MRLILLLCVCLSIQAQTVHIYGGEDQSEYLGCLNCVKSDDVSIWNRFGDYGSKYNSSCIWDKYGTYGGKYGMYTPFNKYGSHPPVLIDEDGGYHGYFTVNESKRPRATFDLAEFIYLLWERIQDDVSSYYDLIVSESMQKYGDVEGKYIFAQDDTYLGFITSNEYESESIINEYGDYGSIYSSTCIYNEHSQYGSDFGSYSAYSTTTYTPPVIYNYNSYTKEFTSLYYLTKNEVKTPRIDPDMLKFIVLQDFYFDNWKIPSPIYTGVQQDIVPAQVSTAGETQLLFNLRGQRVVSRDIPEGVYVRKFRHHCTSFIRLE